MNNNEKLPLCIKLDKNIRDKFKQLTHEKSTTMQGVILAFIGYYIEHPAQFLVQNNSSMSINEQTGEVPSDRTI
jgi:hypothetical protein